MLSTDNILLRLCVGSLWATILATQLAARGHG